VRTADKTGGAGTGAGAGIAGGGSEGDGDDIGNVISGAGKDWCVLTVADGNESLDAMASRCGRTIGLGTGCGEAGAAGWGAKIGVR
jgi:hypothetical protein